MKYDCQNYDINRLCRFDRRALDRRCDGCQRTTDQAYLESQGLWIVGISHALPVVRAEPGRLFIERFPLREVNNAPMV